MTIAALLACHNRKEKTEKCLSTLLLFLPQCDVYLVDDASTDGTYEAIKEKFPSVNLIKGDGSLFWSKGMHTAWKEAIKGKYDYYLWLNDDIELYPFFLQELIECSEFENSDCIVSGLIENFEKTKILYGGYNVRKQIIQSNNVPQEIMFMNGNVVLVPRSVVEKIGIIDPKYQHDLGDVDYGLTAKKNNIKVLSTRIAIARGYSNNFCRVRKWNSTLIERLKKLYSPLGSNPIINFYYRKKNYSLINASMYFAYLHILNILPDTIVELVFGDIYKDKQ